MIVVLYNDFVRFWIFVGLAKLSVTDAITEFAAPRDLAFIGGSAPRCSGAHPA